MAIVTFTYPGRAVTRGCQHMAVWLPLFSELCRVEGLVRDHLDVSQVLGNYSKSAATHLDGTAADVWQTDTRVAGLAREAGAPGSWPRGAKWGQPSMSDHTHMVLDCPCSSRADYQITAVKAGYDGTGSGGRAGKDYIAKPSTWRSYESGLAWMRQRIDTLTPKPPVPEEDIMASLSELRAQLRATLTDDKLVTVGSSKWSVTHVLDWLRRGRTEDAARIAGLQASIKELASKQGVDVDKVYQAAYDGALKGAESAE